MKTLYITHQYFPYFYTGTELLTDNLSRYNRSLGIETEVWSYNLEGNGKKEPQVTDYKGMKVVFFSHHNKDVFRDTNLYISAQGNKEEIRKMLKALKPDVLHVTQVSRMGDIVAVAKEEGIPYIATVTDYWLLCPTATLIKPNGDLCYGTKADAECVKYCYHNNKSFMEERWEAVNSFLNNASKVTYAANFVKGMFENNGIDTKNWIRIKHGYNISNERKREKDKVYRFAFTGTLQRSKGGHLVIEAFRKLTDPQVRLAVYGELKHDLEYSNYCQALAKGDDRIEFRGRYDHTKLTEEFKDIDCIVVPSNWFEPFPFTLISAVAYGFPVIGARIGGIPEIIGAENSDSLFEAGDTIDLRKKMQVKISQGQETGSKIFYEQSIEAEGYNYFQIYNYLK